MCQYYPRYEEFRSNFDKIEIWIKFLISPVILTDKKESDHTGLGEFVVIVSRIKHVKVGLRLNVTNNFQDQRRLSIVVLLVSCFVGHPELWENDKRGKSVNQPVAWIIKEKSLATPGAIASAEIHYNKLKHFCIFVYIVFPENINFPVKVNLHLHSTKNSFKLKKCSLVLTSFQSKFEANQSRGSWIL